MKTATFEIKVFKKGNYIYVVPTDSETEIEGFAKDVKIVRKSITSTDWAFYGFNSDVEIRDYEFPISLIKKENGDAYTNEEFKTWKEKNTGFNGGGTAPNDVWQAQVFDNRTSVIYGNKLYILSDTVTLPFNSTDFATELAGGIWVEVLPDASETIAGKVNTGTQKFKGNKEIIGESATTGSALTIKNLSGNKIAEFSNNIGFGSKHKFYTGLSLETDYSNNLSIYKIQTPGNNDGATLSFYQADGINRVPSSSGVGRVISTIYFHQYDGGSYKQDTIFKFTSQSIFNIFQNKEGSIGGAVSRSLVMNKGKLGINTLSDNVLGCFEVNSTNNNETSLPYPRMTEAQRLAIASPPQGGGVYQTDAGTGGEGIYVFTSNLGWRKLLV